MTNINIWQLQITRLLFGANFSPLWAIYELQKRAEHNKSKFAAAFKAIKRHFLGMTSSSVCNNCRNQRSRFTDNKTVEELWLQFVKVCFKRTTCTRLNSRRLRRQKKQKMELLTRKILTGRIPENFVLFPLKQFSKDSTAFIQRKSSPSAVSSDN